MDVTAVAIRDALVRVVLVVPQHAQVHARESVQLDAIMVALDVVLLVRQHVVIYARDRVATMNAKLHVHQIVDPHVVQLVKMIVPMAAKTRVVLIIVLVDATHLV